jgi:hypothetical protein
MSIFRRCRRLTLLVLLVLWSCGAIDGGDRGSGITATVQGAVQAVQSSSGQGSSVQGIRASVKGHGAKSVTDSTGTFQVQGQFSGHLTVLFTRKSDGLRATLSVYLPSSGILTLNGVSIDATNGTVTVASANVDFLGLITQVDCAGQTLTMLSAKRPAGDTDQYVVDLSNSTITDSQGKPVSCLAVQSGQTAHVQGEVENDGSFGNATIVVE